VISPKLVEVGRHLNINLVTNSEVKSIAGEPGNFEVTLTNTPRYIDLDARVAVIAPGIARLPR